MVILYVKKQLAACQEQIDLSGFVAHDLSAFAVLQKRAF